MARCEPRKAMRRSSRIVALSVAVFLGVGVVASGAQEGVAGSTPVYSGPKKQPSKTDLQKEKPTIRVQSNLVMTPVTVLDRAGEFVYDLQENDFEILDNGVPQRLERFETEASPLAAVIVIQTNRDVAPLLKQVQPLAPVFSSLVLGARGSAAVIVFNDRVQVAQTFSSDGDQLSSAFAGLAARGDSSRLNDALMRGIAMLEQRPREERRVIVAFSDGFDRGSETDSKEVVQRATNTEVAIYGLGFNPAHELLMRKPQGPPPSPLDTNVARPLPPGTVSTPTNSENVYGAPIPVVPILVATGEVIRSAVASSLLEYYAGYTGGVFYSHWSKKALEEQLTRIATEIHSQYELAYVPDTLSHIGFHRIEIRVRRHGVKVRARAGYFYPGANPSDSP